MKNIKMFLVSSALLVGLMGCSNTKEMAPGDFDEVEKDVQALDENFSTNILSVNELTSIDNDEVLFTLNGVEIFAKVLKDEILNEDITFKVNDIIRNLLLMQMYPVSDEEVEKEIQTIKESFAGFPDEFISEQTSNKNQIRYQIAYEKALRDNVVASEEELVEIYDKYFADFDERSFEEMKDEIEHNAPFYLGSGISEIQQEWFEEADLEFFHSALDRLNNEQGALE